MNRREHKAHIKTTGTLKGNDTNCNTAVERIEKRANEIASLTFASRRDGVHFSPVMIKNGKITLVAALGKQNITPSEHEK